MISMQKRGQAAIEFLTTYGWAILILMVVIGLLFSLNIFNPKIKNECIASEPISCEGIKVDTSGNLIIVLTASGVDKIEKTFVEEIKLKSPSIIICNPSNQLPNDVQTQITCSMGPLNEGSKFSGEATIKYILPGGDSGSRYTSIATFSGMVEE